MNSGKWLKFQFTAIFNGNISIPSYHFNTLHTSNSKFQYWNAELAHFFLLEKEVNIPVRLQPLAGYILLSTLVEPGTRGFHIWYVDLSCSFHLSNFWSLVIVSSIILAFRRLEMPEIRRLAIRSYVFHNVSPPKHSFLPFFKIHAILCWFACTRLSTCNGSMCSTCSRCNAFIFFATHSKHAEAILFWGCSHPQLFGWIQYNEI